VVKTASILPSNSSYVSRSMGALLGLVVVGTASVFEAGHPAIPNQRRTGAHVGLL
jgi:hypothetical protein